MTGVVKSEDGHKQILAIVQHEVHKLKRGSDAGQTILVTKSKHIEVSKDQVSVFIAATLSKATTHHSPLMNFIISSMEMDFRTDLHHEYAPANDCEVFSKRSECRVR